jgi:hypothetical protein
MGGILIQQIQVITKVHHEQQPADRHLTQIFNTVLGTARMLRELLQQEKTLSE